MYCAKPTLDIAPASDSPPDKPLRPLRPLMPVLLSLGSAIRGDALIADLLQRLCRLAIQFFACAVANRNHCSYILTETISAGLSFHHSCHARNASITGSLPPPRTRAVQAPLRHPPLTSTPAVSASVSIATFLPLRAHTSRPFDRSRAATGRRDYFGRPLFAAAPAHPTRDPRGR